jgi:hypothetical protein
LLAVSAAAAPALVESADDPPAKIAAFVNKNTLSGARFYFDDRDYRGSFPAWLDGDLYFESSAGRPRRYRCLRAGSVIALAPVNAARDLTAKMDELGFMPMERFVPMRQKTFSLFKNHRNIYAESDIYGAFVKELHADETLTLPPWVILAGFDAPRNPPSGAGEVLYNGIRLPDRWPPKNDLTTDDPPPAVPWLRNRPAVVPIDIGRQLFVDDFLIEKTSLAREFHYPEKYAGNPVLKAETPLEHGRRDGKIFAEDAGAGPKSGGLWWNPEKQLFELWYEAGWLGAVAYATSRDGLRWERPDLPLHPGTNQVLHIPPNGSGSRWVGRADSWTVVRDDDTPDPLKKFKLFLNSPGIGNHFHSYYATSPDGINWGVPHANGGINGDRSTMFYNPFRKKWVFSLRWDISTPGWQRARAYWESADFERGAAWLPDDPVPWARADRLDLPDPRVGDKTGGKTQLYNLDAVAYESLLLGFFQIWFGPENNVAEKRRIPKFTGLNFAYSRDGFHWHRPDRNIAINSEHAAGKWDRGYVQSLGNLCVIHGDKIWFYYIGFSGDESHKNGMHAGMATGIATLRRDGFASMGAGREGGVLLTRPVRFSGSRLFVNAAAQSGLSVEVCDEAGSAIAPFTQAGCIPFAGDGTLAEIRWGNAGDLSALAGKTVRFRFHLGAGAKLFSFWVSRDATGRSDGYLAGGGPGYTGPADTVGRAALAAGQ